MNDGSLLLRNFKIRTLYFMGSQTLATLIYLLEIPYETQAYNKPYGVQNLEEVGSEGSIRKLQFGM